MNVTYPSRSIEQSQPTGRSRTFITACKAKDMAQKMDWLEAFHGNKTMAELVEEGR
jgi:hypothetical protein